MIRPEFLKFVPADAERVGMIGALILALVRFRVELPDEKNGRVVVDGVTWWRASHADISDELGGDISSRTVGRVIGELVDSEQLLAIHGGAFYGDRAKRYRLPDQPFDKSDSSNGQPFDKSDVRHPTKATDDIGHNRQMFLSPENEGEERENASTEVADHEPREQRTRNADSAFGDIEPPEFCDDHMPNGTGDSCPACKIRRKHLERWREAATVRMLQRGSSASERPDMDSPSRQASPKPGRPVGGKPAVIDVGYGPRCSVHGWRQEPPADCEACGQALRDSALVAESRDAEQRLDEKGA